MPLATQIILSLVLGVLVVGVVVALLSFPASAYKAPIAARERARALAGLLAVLVGDAAIVLVVVWGVTEIGGLDKPSAVALASGAFTAVSTMTTAYLGLKAVSNTAQVMSQGSDVPGAGPTGGTTTPPDEPPPEGETIEREGEGRPEEKGYGVTRAAAGGYRTPTSRVKGKKGKKVRKRPWRAFSRTHRA
ncbi:hypothetical protein J7E95_39690 [Streptomyces sp. ISL-14]|nr:hypothetical protein [Streptomyces sp. ISL-14]